jgi:hypothetical protein
MEPEVDSGAKNDQTNTTESIPVINRQTLVSNGPGYNARSMLKIQDLHDF